MESACAIQEILACICSGNPHVESRCNAGPILERRGMDVVFRKRAKNGKTFQILGKNVQNLKIF